MAMIVCRVTPTCSARSAWVIPAFWRYAARELVTSGTLADYAFHQRGATNMEVPPENPAALLNYLFALLAKAFALSPSIMPTVYESKHKSNTTNR